MVRPIIRSSVPFGLLVWLSIQGSTSFEQENGIRSVPTQFSNQEACQNPGLSPDFGKIPLYFVPNRGQVDERALFYAKASRYTLWLTEEGLVFDSTRRISKESAEPKTLSPRDMNDAEDLLYERDVSRLVFLKAYRRPEVIPVDATDHRVNYFMGNDESKWRSNIQASRAVLYKELYPNIDLRVYGVEKQIEYDFAVKPGGEVSDIGLEYKDVKTTRIDSEGNLIVNTEFGEIIHAKPVGYQVIGGERIEIQAEFMKIGDNNYGFKVKGHDRNYELIIDPAVLVYSTYLGGSGEDRGWGMAVDSEGMAYVTGDTDSMNFPTQSPIQTTNAGDKDIFITKVNSSGSALIYSTFLGGSGADYGNGIAVDSEGAAYVAGDTGSVDFPTQNPIQGTYAGGIDAFITKINSLGTALIYSTYLGGSGGDLGFVIGVDSEGAACVTGVTWSTDFPTQNPIQGGFGGGEDIFITKINSLGSVLIYSTYLGGSGGERGWGIGVDSEGATYVTGRTASGDFPTKNPIQENNHGGHDIFIAKLALSDITPTTYSLTVAAGGGGTTDPSPGTYKYDVGTAVTIRAVPNSGYTFSGWSGDASGTANPLTVTMDSNKSVTAGFTKVQSEDDGGGGGGGCFIATACYGTSMAEEVKILSAFRDQYLMINPTGKAIIRFYEEYGPGLADFIRDKEELKTIIRACLKPIVWMISQAF